jgi:serine/threonine-protein kinase
MGTPLYMAPEQFNPSARLSGTTDLYSLAMVVFTLLAGKAYWADEGRAGNVFALAAMVMRGPAEPASVRAARYGSSLPPSFDAWFATATAFDPAQRFPTGAALTAALAVALGVAPPGRVALPSLPIREPSAPVPEPATIPLAAAKPTPPAPDHPEPVTGAGTSATARLTAITPTGGSAPSTRIRIAAGMGVSGVALSVLSTAVYFAVHSTRAATTATPVEPAEAGAIPPISPAEPAPPVQAPEETPDDGGTTPPDRAAREPAAPATTSAPVLAAPRATSSAPFSAAKPIVRPSIPPPPRKKYSQD